ncbi:MAG TPA: hypothetical protein DFS52_17740, partial [Myxococcales bacterium]|nr:hypothetical protein [Myxococcales bacterium]
MRSAKMKNVALLNSSTKLASREPGLGQRVRALFAAECVEAQVRTVPGLQRARLASVALASDAAAEATAVSP